MLRRVPGGMPAPLSVGEQELRGAVRSAGWSVRGVAGDGVTLTLI